MRRAACGGGHTAPRYLATSHIQQGVAKTAAAENTPDPGAAAVNICCWWWLLVAAAGLQSGRGGLLSAGPGQRTADSGHRGRAPPAVPAHAAPGTCGDHSQAGDTWHVAPRDWRRGHTCPVTWALVCCQPPLVWARGRLRWLVAGLAGAAPPPATARLATFK